MGYRTDDQCQPGTCDFGDLVYKANATTNNGIDRSHQHLRKHADIWWVFKWLRKKLKDMGHPYTGALRIAYPQNEFGGTRIDAQRSYVNPITNQIQLVRHTDIDDDDFFSPLYSTLIHEAGHVWAFQQSNSNIRATMLTYWLTHMTNGDTHGFVANPVVSFQEGFGEVFGEYFYRHLLNALPELTH